MLIPFTRPAAAPVPPARAYRDRGYRTAMVAGLLAQKQAQGGVLYRDQIRAVAEQHGFSDRHVRRAVEEAESKPEAGRGRWQPPREVLVRIALERGNVARAYAELRAEADAGLLDFDLPSYPTVCRALTRDAGLAAALRRGFKDFEKYLMVGVYEAERRNEIHLGDGWRVPVHCRDQYGRLVDKLWLFAIFDEYSRAVVAHCFAVGGVTGDLVASTIFAASFGHFVDPAMLRERGVVPPPSPRLGGTGGITRLDNAAENKGHAAEEACRLTDGHLSHADPQTPQQKAKLERFWDTLAGAVASLPGYKRLVPAGPGQAELADAFPIPPTHRLLRVEDVIAAIEHAIEDYNWNHVVETTGEAPIPRFFRDQTLQRWLVPEVAWPNMFVLGSYKVHPRGIKLPTGYHTLDHRDFTPGATVEARWFPGKPGRVLVGRDGRLLGEAVPNRNLGEDQERARGARNAARENNARSIAREAEERRHAESKAGGRASEVAPRRRRRPEPLEPRQAALLEMEWTDPTKEMTA